MKIGGLQKFSLIDYPSKISAILFTSGCNFRCPYCYNKELVFSNKGSITDEEVFEFLESRNGLIEGLVITGGEPTLQHDLIEFIDKVKEMGFLVKLDTNGSRPDVLESALQRVNYVAMDVKMPVNKMNIVGAETFVQNIEKSIKLILDSGVRHEFRVTAYPLLNKDDYEKIFSMVKGTDKIAIQQFVRKNLLSEEAGELEPRKIIFLERMIDIAKKYAKTAELRV